MYGGGHQFWRTQLQEKPYLVWDKDKKASLDNWIVRKVLGWQPHQTRYLGKERFQEALAAVREVMFQDLVPAAEAAEAALTEKELETLRYERAEAEYKDLEARMVKTRPSQWSEEELSGMSEWLQQNHEYVLLNVKDKAAADSVVPGGLTDLERRRARLKVLQYMAFPLLRPEFQAVPSLSRFLAKAVLDMAKLEAYGLRPILRGPLGGATPDYAAAESMLNEWLPKFIVKTYVVVAVERPFTWRLLQHVLTTRAAQCKPEELSNLPELRGLSSPEEVASVVEERWRSLSETLFAIAYDDDVTRLKDDIQKAYQGINELHRIAEELLHLHGPGHPIDDDIQAFLDDHHGFAEEVKEDLSTPSLLSLLGDRRPRLMMSCRLAMVQDAAVAEGLRKYDETVDEMLKFEQPLLEKAAESRLRQESDVLESARLDFTWQARWVRRMTR